MNTTITDTIELANGHTLVLEDLSRKIGADAVVVIFKATMTVPIHNGLFSGENTNDIAFDDIHDILGESVMYEYRAERNMIMDHEKDAVYQGLARTFMANLKPYIETTAFPEKLVLKHYREALAAGGAI